MAKVEADVALIQSKVILSNRIRKAKGGSTLVVIKLRNSVQQAPPDKYKTIDEFFADMYDYGEIVFAYGGQKYIVTYYDSKLSISESQKPDSVQIFASPEEFANNCYINGNKFQDIATKIDVLIRE